MIDDLRLLSKGIGASEVAAAVGLNPWQAPIQIFQTLVEGLEVPDNPAMKWGRILEGPIRQEYADKLGERVIVRREPFFRDDWKRASPDGLVVDEGDRPKWGLEVKTADEHLVDEWGEAGSDEVPIQYVAQTAWSMHVLDLPRWDVAALIGGHDFRIYRLERNLEFERDLVERVEEFWQRYVVPRVPPPVDASDAYRDYLTRRWDKVSADYREATGQEEGALAALLLLKDETRTLDGQVRLMENRLRESIADAPGLLTSMGKVHCKPQVRTTVDWEAIARHLALREGLSDEFLRQLTREYKRESAPFRALRLPRRKGEGE